MNLRDLNIDELKEYFVSIGEKPFRAAQLFAWLNRGVTSFEDMSDLSKDLRQKLETAKDLGEITLGDLDILKKQTSASDGTIKYLFGLQSGDAIESVFMKYKYGNSICVSSQAGCKMGCAFCASTINGLSRNLSPGEILMQVLKAQNDTGEKINHIVIMGSGEPFDNYDNVYKFIKLANDPKGLNISMRNITVSTCGLLPKIDKFANDLPQVNLAISLHAPNDKIRNEIMPINSAYPISDLIGACRHYTNLTGRRITFEYALIRDFNDKKAHAEELASLLHGLLCHVNLIPLNAVSESSMQGTVRKKAEEFMNILTGLGIPATVRRTLGADIDAACGQLRLSQHQSLSCDH